MHVITSVHCSSAQLKLSKRSRAPSFASYNTSLGAQPHHAVSNWRKQQLRKHAALVNDAGSHVAAEVEKHYERVHKNKKLRNRDETANNLRAFEERRIARENEEMMRRLEHPKRDLELGREGTKEWRKLLKWNRKNRQSMYDKAASFKRGQIDADNERMARRIQKVQSRVAEDDWARHYKEHRRNRQLLSRLDSTLLPAALLQPAGVEAFGGNSRGSASGGAGAGAGGGSVSTGAAGGSSVISETRGKTAPKHQGHHRAGDTPGSRRQSSAPSSNGSVVAEKSQVLQQHGNSRLRPRAEGGGSVRPTGGAGGIDAPSGPGPVRSVFRQGAVRTERLSTPGLVGLFVDGDEGGGEFGGGGGGGKPARRDGRRGRGGGGNNTLADAIPTDAFSFKDGAASGQWASPANEKLQGRRRRRRRRRKGRLGGGDGGGGGGGGSDPLAAVQRLDDGGDGSSDSEGEPSDDPHSPIFEDFAKFWSRDENNETSSTLPTARVAVFRFFAFFFRHFAEQKNAKNRKNATPRGPSVRGRG